MLDERSRTTENSKRLSLDSKDIGTPGKKTYFLIPGNKIWLVNKNITDSPAAREDVKIWFAKDDCLDFLSSIWGGKSAEVKLRAQVILDLNLFRA